jgi:hypothetical protein
MLMLMPLAPYWDARACRRAFACVYYDTMLEVEGNGREAELCKCQSRKVGELYARHRGAQYTAL